MTDKEKEYQEYDEEKYWYEKQVFSEQLPSRKYFLNRKVTDIDFEDCEVHPT